MLQRRLLRSKYSGMLRGDVLSGVGVRGWNLHGVSGTCRKLHTQPRLADSSVLTCATISPLSGRFIDERPDLVSGQQNCFDTTRRGRTTISVAQAQLNPR